MKIKRRQRPTAPLARKLRVIRLWKGMSQTEILRLVFPDAARDQRALVSQWENAKREPLRQVLIRYARLAEISLDELLIDEQPISLRISEAARAESGYRKN